MPGCPAASNKPASRGDAFGLLCRLPESGEAEAAAAGAAVPSCRALEEAAEAAREAFCAASSPSTSQSSSSPLCQSSQHAQPQLQRPACQYGSPGSQRSVVADS
mmetsp:Transcript_16552/g.29029  ORF Transcript_16552/g.29029 Transcript_16552/m.29029 type:complete len:104 (-) Transcript_16552:126-437(-)